MPVVAVVLLLALAMIAFVPLSLVLRYRASTARRLARGWVATLNVLAIASSVALFLITAAVTGFWVPRAFPYSLMGLGRGACSVSWASG